MSMITIIVVMIMVVNIPTGTVPVLNISPTSSSYNSSICCSVCGRYQGWSSCCERYCCLGISSISRLVADLHCCYNLASIQCMLALPESTLCYTSDATALASIDPASADHNPARFRDSSISSAISRQLQSIRPNSNDAQFIYTICSHGKASVLVRDSSISSATSMQRKSVVTMLILSKLFTWQNIRQH